MNGEKGMAITLYILTVGIILLPSIILEGDTGRSELYATKGLALSVPSPIVIFAQSKLVCANDARAPGAAVQRPHFVLGAGTLRVAATRSKIVAEDRVHSLKALLKGTGWSRHLRIRPAAGHSGVRFAVDVTQVEADAGTVFCHWLERAQGWKPGPYPCEMAY